MEWLDIIHDIVEIGYWVISIADILHRFNDATNGESRK